MTISERCTYYEEEVYDSDYRRSSRVTDYDDPGVLLLPGALKRCKSAGVAAIGRSPSGMRRKRSRPSIGPMDLNVGDLLGKSHSLKTSRKGRKRRVDFQWP